MSRCSESADHCPFLNRRDARCGQHMSVNGLDHAFDYCFGQYQVCPVYFELLIERRVRRGEALLAEHQLINRGPSISPVVLTISHQAIDAFARSVKASGLAAHANAA